MASIENFPTFERRELSGHASRGGMSIGGIPAILFGTPFVAIGVGILLVLGGVVGSYDPSGDAPRLVIAPMASVFAAAGLWLWIHGVTSKIRGARTNRLKARHPNEPWMWDHRWNPQGEKTRELRGAFGASVFIVFMGFFLVPFNWWAFDLSFLGLESKGSEQFNPILILIVGVFDLLWLVIVGALVYHVLRFLRFGNSSLRFHTFPFFLGGELEVSLENARRFEKFNSVELHLRYVEEVYESRGSGSSGSSQVVCYALYEDRQRLQPEQLKLTPDDRLLIRFPLPTDPLSNLLSEHPPRYWEIEIKGDAVGVDYGAIFPLPVYER
jgi:hypothetical protein